MTPPPITDTNGQALKADGGNFALPHVYTFASLMRGADNTYWHERFDEAMKRSRADALAMRRDCFLMGLLQERKLAVQRLNWHLKVPDDKDPRQAATRQLITQVVRGIPEFDRITASLLEAIWYGRYGVQVVWKWKDVAGKRCLSVSEWCPENGDKLGNHTDGTPYILVGSEARSIPGAEIITTTRAQALLLKGSWRERFLIHKHEVDDADYFEAEGAGGRFGVGIRSRIFWLDFLRREYLEWVVTYMERVGLGLTLWYYDASNPEAKAEAERAARENSRRVNLLVPIWPDSRGKPTGSVERVETPTAGVEALQKMAEHLERVIERFVVGQEGSSRASSSGLSNEASAEFQQDTKAAIRDQDADWLAATYTGNDREPGLVNMIQRWTCPDTLPHLSGGFPVQFVFGLEKVQNDKKMNAIKTVVDMGCEVKKDDVYNAAGLSRPEETDDVVGPQQQMPGMPGGLPPGTPGAPGSPEGEAGGPVPGFQKPDRPAGFGGNHPRPHANLTPAGGTNPRTGQPYSEHRHLDSRTGKVRYTYDRDGNLTSYEWSPYTGPRGGKGWQEGEKIVYGEQKPGERGDADVQRGGDRQGGGADRGGSPAGGEDRQALRDDLADHIERARANPTPESVAELARTLSQYTHAQLRELKQSLGVRAGGKKAVLAQKLATLATKRLTVREHWVREARKVGVKVRDLIATASQVRGHYRDVVQLQNNALARAKALYQHYAGKQLSRAHPAFRGGDHTQLHRWDDVSQSLAAEFPELFAGFDGMQLEERLLDLVAAGRQKPLSYGHSYRDALDYLSSQKRERDEEMVPFYRPSVPALYQGTAPAAAPLTRADLEMALGAVAERLPAPAPQFLQPVVNVTIAGRPTRKEILRNERGEITSVVEHEQEGGDHVP